ncbi:nuclear transport factor 2 family protein [Mycobacterium sp. MS1601]|uniref:nuclear transport factor 2 family protein n=1 Tax=Mycobacterium sp. MS1601 TaxID=1936029 RepID=UPI0018D3F946|nr:nuclear transport factor 2 family protein [Mycobacterium sp. MS1601]
MVDRAEILDVLTRYTRGLDRVEMDLVRSAFHDDAWVEFPEDVYRGPATGFCNFLAKEMTLFVRTRHHLGNILIEFEGDVAFVETYLNADHEATSYHKWNGAFVTLWARYTDRFEKRNGVWKIAHRTLLIDWMRKDDDPSGWYKIPEAQMGKRDGTDLVLRAHSS